MTTADSMTVARGLTRSTVCDELQGVVSMLCERFPQRSQAEVQQLVADVHRQLSDSARIHDHLIPLTLNRARRTLAKSPSGRAKSPQWQGRLPADGGSAAR